MKKTQKSGLSRLLALVTVILLVLTTSVLVASAQVPTEGSAGLAYTLNPDGNSYTVTGYSGTDSEVVIPVEHKGLPVTSLKADIFWSEKDFAGTVLPDGSIMMPGDLLFSPVEKIIFLSRDIEIPDRADSLPEDVVISAYTYTTAHQYAKSYNRTFESLNKPTILKASVELGADITIHYTADIADHEASEAKMRFSVDGRTAATVVGVAGNVPGQYVFSFKGINPHTVGDNLCAELLINGAVAHTIDTYSIRQYCLNMLNRIEAQSIPGYDETKYALLRTLIAYLLQYCADTQVYTNHNTDALVNEGITGMSAYVSPSEEYANVAISTSTATDGTHLRSVAVELSNTIRLRFSLVAADISRITLKVGGVTYGPSDFTDTKTTNLNGLPIYSVYSGGIYASQIESDFDAVLCIDGEPCQTLTYSVLNYVYRKQNDPDTALASLVKILLIPSIASLEAL